jgi:class 3 adenylate cyclase
LGKPEEPSLPPYARPQPYPPKYLAEKILMSRGALEGERKQVTVLFADLKGSMELIAERDPEEARRLLHPALERMTAAVYQYEGTVAQIMGDGIMALFGAPLAHEDHAVRACYAALRIQEAIRQHNERLRRTEGVEVQVRVGLNSGEVVVVSVGSDLQMEYTAVGHTTYLAARMEQLAAPGSIRLTVKTLRLAEGFIKVEPLGPVPLKGLADPVEVYELIVGRPVRTRVQAVADRGLTRFVGRDAEMGQLRRALQQAADRHGQVMAVVGEPGVGKSRLFHEFIHSHCTEGWLVLEAASVSYGKATLYFPVVDLLKVYFRIQGSDDRREVHQKIIGKLLELDPTLQPALPAFLALFDLPVEDTQWQDLQPPQRRQRILEAMKRLMLRESQVQPLLVICEDLHWIDSETQAVLDGLVEILPTARILLLVNYRPEYQHPWGSKTYYSQLRIDPLPLKNAEEFLEGLLGAEKSLEALKRLLLERTERNPFFLEETVRTLAERRALVGGRGAYRLAAPLVDIQVPTTVQAVLASRIDGLPPEEKRLVQTAAVIGKDFPFSILQAIADLPEEALRLGLTHLQAAEFLYETTLFPDLEFTFKHSLTHEVAYGSLLQERRCALHARILEAMERLHAERLAEYVERLAHHAMQGQRWEKALMYFRQAGCKALTRSANQEAVVSLEHALEALQYLPPHRDRMEQAIDIRFEIRTALLPLGEIGKILTYLQEAENLAENLKDQRRLGWVSTYMTIYFLMCGNTEQALAAGQRAVAIAEDLGDDALRVVADAYVAWTFRDRGSYRQAGELSWKTVHALTGDRIRERFGQVALPAVFARTTLAFCFAEQGEFAKGIGIAEEALRIAESVDQPFSLMLACLGVGQVYLRRGELQKAISAQQRALELIQTWKIPTWFPWAAASFGYALTLAGNLSEGMQFLEDANQRAVAIPFLINHSLWLVWLGEAHLLAGRTDKAAKIAEKALSLCRDRSERGHMAWAFRLQGEILGQGDGAESDKAEEYYRRSLTLAEDLDMHPLVAHCHLGFGRLYRRTGDQMQSQEHFTAATTLFRKMEMAYWLEKAKRVIEKAE